MPLLPNVVFPAPFSAVAERPGDGSRGASAHRIITAHGYRRGLAPRWTEGRVVSGPKGRHSRAQGNALGGRLKWTQALKGRHNTMTIRARNGSAPSGLMPSGATIPGLRPGLSNDAPLGLGQTQPASLCTGSGNSAVAPASPPSPAPENFAAPSRTTASETAAPDIPRYPADCSLFPVRFSRRRLLLSE